MNTILVTPLYRTFIDSDELQSIIHLLHYLPDIPKAIVCPDSLAFHSPYFRREPFADHYFQDVAGYNRLMLSTEFYDRFSTYDYILIVQLDALVLASNLEPFLNYAVDYMGAPWFKNKHQPQKGFLGAGNGGLSLRRVTAFQYALQQARLDVRQALNLLLDVQDTRMIDLQRDQPFIRFLKKINFIRKTWQRGTDFIEKFEWNEDLFWALRIPFLVDQFNVASVEQSLSFAFEMHPAYCFALTNHQLPFGCHAWAKYDRQFWEPYLLPANTISVTLDKIITFK